METRASRRCVVCLFYLAGLLLPAALAAPAGADDPAAPGLVAVAIVDGGRAILLATPAIPTGGRLWRFRSLDTRAVAQPIQDIQLSASGTKLFLQPASGPGAVIDLTRQPRPNASLQRVDPRDLAIGGDAGGQSHRLPFQRFVSLQDGAAYVVDDSGAVQVQYPPLAAATAAVADDGVVLYVRTDRSVSICGETESNRAACRELHPSLDSGSIDISARSRVRPTPPGSARFLLLVGPGDRTRIVDPEQGAGDGRTMSRTEASLRACLALHGMSMSDRRVGTLVGALLEEARNTRAAANGAVSDWRFFHVTADEELYVPVLQFAQREAVFPSAFETLEELWRPASAASRDESATLYDEYTSQPLNARKERCTLYFRTLSEPGSWIIEYWFYYPFDVGGLGQHLHDSEHLFVEVDQLGGTVRRLLGAGHGFLAGNNMYSTDRPGAQGVDLPLFAIVEQGKHATAPDVDRDGAFTPGLDENEYGERAKTWGVRDAIGTINNELLAYDNTMTSPRRREDCLAARSLLARFPMHRDLAPYAWCRLQPMPPGDSRLPFCGAATTDCAKRYIISDPDFRRATTILKEWVFPESFLRATYGAGPSFGKHSLALGYAVDLAELPGVRKFIPLPGRITGEVFGWRQDGPNVATHDPEACIGGPAPNRRCKYGTGVGWGGRYEQFLSNIFGLFSAVRVYRPPTTDTRVTFGPFVEVSVFNHSNLTVLGGLAFEPVGSAPPRFELKVSMGVWKPKSRHVGVPARSDHS